MFEFVGYPEMRLFIIYVTHSKYQSKNKIWEAFLKKNYEISITIAGAFVVFGFRIHQKQETLNP
jgi:hypothetical protein